jgi:hypothetical protein
MPVSISKLNQNTFELTYQIETGLILFVLFGFTPILQHMACAGLIYKNLLQGKRNGFIF